MDLKTESKLIKNELCKLLVRAKSLEEQATDNEEPADAIHTAAEALDESVGHISDAISHMENMIQVLPLNLAEQADELLTQFNKYDGTTRRVIEFIKQHSMRLALYMEMADQTNMTTDEGKVYLRRQINLIDNQWHLMIGEKI